MVPHKDGSVKEAEHAVQMSNPLKLEKLLSIKFFRASTHGCANRFFIKTPLGNMYYINCDLLLNINQVCHCFYNQYLDNRQWQAYSNE